MQPMIPNSRSYLGRFAQADSIVSGGAQGYDRYAYANNSPMVYVDPSGHSADCGIGDPFCHGGVYLSPEAQDLIDFSEIVGKKPEDVIAIGIGHEMGGWNAHDLEIAKGHFANRFIHYAQTHCGGNVRSYTCKLNFFMDEYQSVQNMVYENSPYGRTHRVHNKYWDPINDFDREQNYKNPKTGAPTAAIQAGIDVMNNFWSDVQPGDKDYTDGGFDTGDYLRADVKDQLGHAPVVGQDGILAIMGITCEEGDGIAIIVDYQGYVTLGSTVNGKHGASVCTIR